MNGACDFQCFLGPRITKLDASHFGRSKRRFCALGNLLTLVFGESRKHVKHKSVRMRVITGNEINLALH